MHDSHDEQDQTKRTGKWMFALAWLAGLGLLTLFFKDQLHQQYNPNQQPISYSNGEVAEVRLKRNRQGHYVSTGVINGQPVVFLLDTGATSVSIPFHLASHLGLSPGNRYPVRTANGTINVAQTNIDQLALGTIQFYDVEANLNPGMKEQEILLGMSVLKHLEFTQKGDWLILKSR